jgi:hypothetical protein
LSGDLNALAPVTITPAMLISSTAPDSEYQPWVSTKTYAQDEYCVSPVTRRIYQSLVAGNVGKDPISKATWTGGIVYWQDMGPTNRWAMFDGRLSTQTIVESPLTVVLQPGPFDTIYLDGVDANTLDIVVRDAPGGEVVFSYSGPLEGSEPADYDEYFYMPFKPQTSSLTLDIPAYGASEVTVTLSTPGGTVKCGVLALGDVHNCGRCETDADVELKSFGSFETDKFGNADIQLYAKAKDINVSTIIPVEDAFAVQTVAESLQGVPAFYFCTNNPLFAGLRTFGLGKFKFSYRNNQVRLSLSVEGMI